MRFYFNGCSWTAGDELKDRYKSRFSTLLGQKYGAEVVNDAMPSSSNQRIARTTYERNPKDYDLAVIQLSYPARTESFFDGSWRQLNCHPNIPRTIEQARHDDDLEYRCSTKVGVSNEKFKEHWMNYYKYIYENEVGAANERSAFWGTKSFFEAAGVPVIMLCIHWNYDKSLPYNFDIRLKNLSVAKWKHPDETGHMQIAKLISTNAHFYTLP